MPPKIHPSSSRLAPAPPPPILPPPTSSRALNPSNAHTTSLLPGQTPGSSTSATEVQERNDPHDILCVMDMVDTLDTMPVDLTKCLADLRELDAVLNATITHLTHRLTSFSSILTNKDPQTLPHDRFQLLLEIAEELTRFKLGGEDKIRVAGAACEMLTTHQTSLSNLLSSSTLLLPPPSFIQPHLPPAPTKRSRNSPMPSRTFNANSTTNNTHTRDRENDGVEGTPSKKRKKGGVAGVKERERDEDWDEDGAGTGTGLGKSPGLSKRAPAGGNGTTGDKKGRGKTSRLSPPESIDPSGYREETPLANATTTGKSRSNKNRATAYMDETNDAQHSTEPGSNRGTPIVDSANGTATTTARSKQRSSNASKKSKTLATDQQYPEPGSNNGGHASFTSNLTGNGGIGAGGVNQGFEIDEHGVEMEADQGLYCYCQKPSYGEMIGCDADDCPWEWFHLACTGLPAVPAGDWMCPDCKEKLVSRGGKPKRKAPAKGGGARRR